MSSSSLPYKTALVTGASRGIGAAICRQLRAMGLTVHALARNHERLEALCAQTGAIAHVADVTDLAYAQQLFDELEIDVLVNNAGAVAALGSLETLDADSVDRMLDINLRAPLHYCRLALAGMVKRRRGHIIHIGSTSGSFVFPGTSPYAAAKAAMTMANRVMRHDLAGSQVRITEISPGRVCTDIYQEAMRDNTDTLRNMYDKHRSVRPEDIAQCVETALRMPAEVDISFMEVSPTDQAPGGHRYATRPE